MNEEEIFDNGSKTSIKNLQNGKQMEWWVLAPLIFAVLMFLLVGTIFEKRIEEKIRSFVRNHLSRGEEPRIVSTQTNGNQTNLASNPQTENSCALNCCIRRPETSQDEPKSDNKQDKTVTEAPKDKNAALVHEVKTVNIQHGEHVSNATSNAKDVEADSNVRKSLSKTQNLCTRDNYYIKRPDITQEKPKSDNKQDKTDTDEPKDKNLAPVHELKTVNIQNREHVSNATSNAKDGEADSGVRKSLSKTSNKTQNLCTRNNYSMKRPEITQEKPKSDNKQDKTDTEEPKDKNAAPVPEAYIYLRQVNRVSYPASKANDVVTDSNVRKSLSITFSKTQNSCIRNNCSIKLPGTTQDMLKSDNKQDKTGTEEPKDNNTAPVQEVKILNIKQVEHVSNTASNAKDAVKDSNVRKSLSKGSTTVRSRSRHLAPDL